MPEAQDKPAVPGGATAPGKRRKARPAEARPAEARLEASRQPVPEPGPAASPEEQRGPSQGRMAEETLRQAAEGPKEAIEVSEAFSLPDLEGVDGSGGLPEGLMPARHPEKERLPIWEVWSEGKAAGPVVFSVDEPSPSRDRESKEKPPQDYIMCLKRHPRLVAACMKNCWLPHYCDEFHRFFARRGQTPIEYYNRDGIGAYAMRRIVFDCDRCGKRDIDPVYSRYSKEGQTEEFLLDVPARSQLIELSGYNYADLGEAVFSLMDHLERQKSWVHLCDKCFGKVADNVAQIMMVQKVRDAAQPPGEAQPAEDQVRKLKKVVAG